MIYNSILDGLYLFQLVLYLILINNHSGLVDNKISIAVQDSNYVYKIIVAATNLVPYSDRSKFLD